MKKNNKEHNHKKKYGQNFLDDVNLLDNIKETTNIKKGDNIIEIGPGLGYLTKMILDMEAILTSFEIDEDLIPKLKNKFKDYGNFTLKNEDFLETDLSKIIKGNEKYKVIANIPYYITSPIINKLLEYRENISEIYLMVQKEVAERLSSEKNNKNTGVFTHIVQFYGEVTYLFTVKKELFYPIPKVDSAFIKIKIYDNKKYEKQINDEKYFGYIKMAFENKRKTLVNNFSKKYKKEIVEKALENIGKNKNARAEELQIEDFINLIYKLENFTKEK